MITIFEGPRNSGKTFLANKFSDINSSKIFKFDFVGWFNNLSLEDNSEATHFVLDRGFLTVLTWGVLSGRISEEKAKSHLTILAEKGLLKNCRIVYVKGDNPSKESRNKDNWDHRDGTSEEEQIMENLRDVICNQPYNVETIFLYNSFDDRIIRDLEKL